MAKSKIYSPQVYPIKLLVVECKSLKTLSKMYNIESVVDVADGSFVGLTLLCSDKDSDDLYITTLFPKKPSLDTAVHESSHAATYYCKLHFIPYGKDVENDESHAYLTEWVFKQIMDFYSIEL